MAITGMEIGCSGRHRYGTIKAAAEADPLLLRKEQQRASRRRLLSVFAAIATMLVVCVLATQARKTPSMMTATITSTEGESPTEGAYNTGLQEPVANSNLLSFKVETTKKCSSCTQRCGMIQPPCACSLEIAWDPTREYHTHLAGEH